MKNENKEAKELPDCCKPVPKGKGILAGIFSGLLAHSFCIAFILFTIIGSTTATTLLRPLMLNAYFFYILVGFSFVFATISALIYLKRNSLLSLEGIKRKKGYLSILYGITIGINLLFFMIIFPYATNLVSATGNVISSDAAIADLSIKVAIPCPGHASLISNEIKTLSGIQSVKFGLPNKFYIKYDSEITSEKQILALEVFKTYKATKI